MCGRASDGAHQMVDIRIGVVSSSVSNWVPGLGASVFVSLPVGYSNV